MNKVILMGRLTRDPNVRYTAGDNPMGIARYTLAVDRRIKREGEATADFISCIAFWKGSRICRKIFPSGYPYCSKRQNSDWKLYKQRWEQSLYNRCCGRRTGIC